MKGYYSPRRMAALDSFEAEIHVVELVELRWLDGAEPAPLLKGEANFDNWKTDPGRNWRGRDLHYRPWPNREMRF